MCLYNCINLFKKKIKIKKTLSNKMMLCLTLYKKITVVFHETKNIFENKRINKEQYIFVKVWLFFHWIENYIWTIRTIS